MLVGSFDEDAEDVAAAIANIAAMFDPDGKTLRQIGLRCVRLSRCKMAMGTLDYCHDARTPTA